MPEIHPQPLGESLDTPSSDRPLATADSPMSVAPTVGIGARAEDIGDKQAAKDSGRVGGTETGDNPTSGDKATSDSNKPSGTVANGGSGTGGPTDGNGTSDNGGGSDTQANQKGLRNFARTSWRWIVVAGMWLGLMARRFWRWVSTKVNAKPDSSNYRCPVCNHMTIGRNDEDDKAGNDINGKGGNGKEETGIDGNDGLGKSSLDAGDQNECSICETDNSRWLQLGRMDHYKRFPSLIWILVLSILVLQVYVACTSPDPADARFRALRSSTTILVFIASLAIVFSVYRFRLPLRNYELLRREKTMRKGPSLVILASGFFAIALVLTLSAVALVRSFVAIAASGTWILSVHDPKEGTDTVVLKERSPILKPSWSLDGEKIIYASNPEQNWEIYILDVDTRQVQNLTRNPAADTNPSWSPDGNRIIFASNRNGTWGLFRMDPQGQQVQPVEGLSVGAVESNWSSKSYKIVYTIPGSALYHSLEDLPDFRNGVDLIRTVAYAGFFPMLILALMLLGAAGYIQRMDEDIHRPIFSDDRKMVKVAFDSCVSEMRAKPPYVTTNNAQKEDGPDDPDPQDAESNAGSQQPPMRHEVFSFKRQPNGGLTMIIHRKAEVMEDQPSGEQKTVPKETFYEVRTNEWAHIQSIQKQDPRKQ